MNLHTILGAGGAIAKGLLDELLTQGEKVRLVSRTIQPTSQAETMAADVSTLDGALRAIQGSAVVYHCVGLPYSTEVWQEYWPPLMTNVIEACKRSGAKLIFFDNVYMYGRVKGRMTEETPFNPISKKGEIRTAIINTLLDEMKGGNLQALIAHCADFYGVYGEKFSLFNFLVLKNLSEGKPAQWLVNAKAKHSFTFTFTTDASKALYQLQGDEKAVGQTWHLPTAPALSAEELIALSAKALKTPHEYMVLSTEMIREYGKVDALTREMYEMLYQYEYDYVFDSSKFERAFGFAPTSYQAGIAQTAPAYQSLPQA